MALLLVLIVSVCRISPKHLNCLIDKKTLELFINPYGKIIKISKSKIKYDRFTRTARKKTYLDSKCPKYSNQNPCSTSSAVSLKEQVR